MVVYVVCNITREHQTEVVGVAATPEAAVELAETYRKEPLRLDKDGGLNNYPAEGPPDWVGFVRPYEVAGSAALLPA